MTVARYTNPEKSGILLSEGDGSICTFVEPVGYYADLYNQAVSGKFGEIEPYIPPPPPSDKEVADQVRAERDRLLAASDWTQVADAPVNKLAWSTYRKALRDLPKQEGFPHSVVWPKKP
jgi:hypothetical protein